VPARSDPVAPDDNRQLIIQAEGNYGGAATSSEAGYFHTLFLPRKMVGPSLPSWMKERNLLLRLWISAVRFCPLVLIAQFAGEAEIIIVV
jgi:hypothetical protein